MSKLPTEFVKAPAPQPKPRTRTKKASLISPEPVRDPRELLMHLTDDEMQMLEDARQKVNQSGVEITLEQMIHRVFADWMVRERTPAPPPPAPAAPRPTPPPRDERMLRRLRELVAAPLQTWRALAVATARAAIASRRARRA